LPPISTIPSRRYIVTSGKIGFHIKNLGPIIISQQRKEASNGWFLGGSINTHQHKLWRKNKNTHRFDTSHFRAMDGLLTTNHVVAKKQK
jgi:hypothetical protein